MERRKIEIRGLPSGDPIIEHSHPSAKCQTELTRTRKIIDRLDEEKKLHPDCKVQIRYSEGRGFELIIHDREDLEFEKRFTKSQQIHQRRITDYRAGLRKAFLL